MITTPAPFPGSGTGLAAVRAVRSVVAHVHPEHGASAAVAAAAGLAPTGVWQDGERRWLRPMAGDADGARVISRPQCGS